MKLDQKVIEEFLTEIETREEIPKIIALKLANFFAETSEIKEETIIEVIEEGFE